MAIIKTQHRYIVIKKDVCGGRPIIQGTRIAVWAIAGWLQKGYSPQEIQKEIYPSLSLAQIHDALSYYYDHRAEVDADIVANNLSEAELAGRRAQWQKRSSFKEDPILKVIGLFTAKPLSSRQIDEELYFGQRAS